MNNTTLYHNAHAQPAAATAPYYHTPIWPVAALKTPVLPIVSTSIWPYFHSSG